MTTLDEAHGLTRIAAAQGLTEVAFNAPKEDGGVLDLSALSSGNDLVPGATDAVLRKAVLKALGVITVGRGAGGPALLAPDAERIGTRSTDAARHLWKKLAASSAKLTRAEVEYERIAGNFSESEYRSGEELLKLLQLAAGVRGAAGGVQPYAELAKEAEQAQQELAKLETKAAQEAVEEATHESIYYEPVADALRRWGEEWAVAVLGVRQRGIGEWSTPDVIAYAVHPAPVTIQPILRVATVEVKHVLTRVAIAEAAAHRRFAHHSYVAAPVAPADIDPSLVTACIEQCVGLICPRQRGSLTFYVLFDPPLHRPDEEEVNFALQQFTDETGRELSRDIFERLRAGFGVLFGPPPR